MFNNKIQTANYLSLDQLLPYPNFRELNAIYLYVFSVWGGLHPISFLVNTLLPHLFMFVHLKLRKEEKINFTTAFVPQPLKGMCAVKYVLLWVTWQVGLLSCNSSRSTSLREVTGSSRDISVWLHLSSERQILPADC